MRPPLMFANERIVYRRAQTVFSRRVCNHSFRICSFANKLGVNASGRMAQGSCEIEVVRGAPRGARCSQADEFSVALKKKNHTQPKKYFCELLIVWGRGKGNKFLKLLIVWLKRGRKIHYVGGRGRGLTHG